MSVNFAQSRLGKVVLALFTLIGSLSLVYFCYWKKKTPVTIEQQQHLEQKNLSDVQFPLLPLKKELAPTPALPKDNQPETKQAASHDPKQEKHPLNRPCMDPKQEEPSHLKQVSQKTSEKTEERALQAAPREAPTQEEQPQHIYKNILDQLVSKQRIEGIAKVDDSFQHIVENLKQNVFGQETAIKSMASQLDSQRTQSGNKVFLYVGPTGVGKTELAKAVAKTKNNRLIMLPMSQFQSEMDVRILFGSSPGFVGSTDKPHLAKEIERYSPVKVREEGSKHFYELENVVFLFDELEKAHPKVKQSLLTLFDEGYCVVNYIQESKNLVVQYNLKKCLIINTSNLYQIEILDAFERDKTIEEIEEIFRRLNTRRPLPTSYSAELLGRMRIIPFGPIPRGECYQGILKLKFKQFLDDLKKEMEFKEIEVDNEEEILSSFEERLYGDGTDIRRIKDYFERFKVIIHEHKSQWGELKKTKIIFLHRDRSPCIKVYTFLEEFESYHETDVPVLTL